MQIDYAKKPKEIQAALADIANGMKAVEAARKHGVCRVSVWRWAKSSQERRRVEPIIIARYATENTADLAKELNLKPKTLQKRASVLGVAKCPTLVASQRSEIIKKSAHGFKKGNKPKKITSVQRSFLEVFQHNAESLNAVGDVALAELTGRVIEKIHGARMSRQEFKFDFLTIHEGWIL